MDAIAESALRHPDHVALDDGVQSWTYAQMHAAVARMARRLEPVGIGSGSVVALVARPGALTVQAIHAVSRTGAALAVLNPALTQVELEAALDVLGATVLLTTHASLADLDADPTWFTVLDDLPQPTAEGPEQRSADVAATPGAGSPIVLWTSGTEGHPRGVVLSREAMRTHAEAVTERLGLEYTDRTLVSLSHAHVGGLATILRAAQVGSTLVVRSSLDAVALASLIDSGEITRASLVPTMLRRLLEARGDARAPGSLRCLLVGGAHAPVALTERALAFGYPIALTYGMTEAGSQVATAPPPTVRDKPGSVGFPLDGTDVQVGDSGEISVSGPALAMGVIRHDGGSVDNPLPIVDGEGAYQTGDLGRVDEDGHLWITGRVGSRIISGGVNVDPQEVADVLESVAGVAEAAVVGVPDPEWGERVVAAVVLVGAPGVDTDLTALNTAARDRLAAPKRPRAISVVEGLPRNSNGKVDSERVRALFRNP